jgi:hypothetical protein
LIILSNKKGVSGKEKKKKEGRKEKKCLGGRYRK